jgi:hypothetical protein
MKQAAVYTVFCLLLSCTPVDTVDYGLDDYQAELATALATPNDFLLDTGLEVHNSNTGFKQTYNKGDRVYLRFSFVDNRTVFLYSASKVTSGVLKADTPANMANYKSDPVRLESAWGRSGYLNVKFYMDYKATPHKLALVVDEAELNAQEVDLYFNHDSAGDTPGYPLAAFVSFDLSKTLGQPLGERTLRVHFNTTNYGNTTYTYKY